MIEFKVRIYSLDSDDSIRICKAQRKTNPLYIIILSLLSLTFFGFHIALSLLFTRKAAKLYKFNKDKVMRKINEHK